MNKQQITDISVANFFRGSRWDFKNYPKEEVAERFSKKRNTTMDLSSIEGTQLYYDIRDFLVCVMTNGEPYTYKSKAFPSLFYLVEFMQMYGYENFSCIDDAKKADEEWLSFWSEIKKRVYVGDYRKVIPNIVFYLQEFRDKRVGLDRDLWRVKDLHINSERINQAKESASLNFYSIENIPNREIIKTWFKYLLGGTELSYYTIMNYLTYCRHFATFLGNKSVLDVTHDDIQNYKQSLSSSNDLNNRMFRCFFQMYKYFVTKRIYDKPLPVTKLDFVTIKYNHVYQSVPEQTILEIFKHIHNLSEDYRLIFLINLFTGIRISDICQLKKDCLLQNELGYFIFHSVQKMQNTGGIPIAKELYDLLKKYIETLSGDCDFIFRSPVNKNQPILTPTYRRYMKKKMKEWGIKLPDGTDYDFVTHAYRHTIATQLYRMGMPSSLIQLGILHHKEINMSRHYIDEDEKMQLEILTEKGINAKSEDIPLVMDGNTALANGYCNMPLAVNCPNASACLNCDYFRTSVAFLDVHEKHLEELEEKITYYKANGYTTNEAFAEKEKAQLVKIIVKLKKIKGDDVNATNNKTTT